MGCGTERERRRSWPSLLLASDGRLRHGVSREPVTFVNTTIGVDAAADLEFDFVCPVEAIDDLILAVGAAEATLFSTPVPVPDLSLLPGMAESNPKLGNSPNVPHLALAVRSKRVLQIREVDIMSPREGWIPLSTAAVRMLGLEQLARSVTSGRRRSRPRQRPTGTLVFRLHPGLGDLRRR